MKLLVILWVVSALFVGCSSKQISAKSEREPASFRVSQNFWVGGPPKTKGPCSPTGKGPGSGSAQSASTPIDALLNVVTLGMYSPLNDRQEREQTPTFCP